MSWKLRALVSAMLLTPAAALALGLGEIRLNSALNEPLSAEIDLVAATPEELAALKAELATNEVFERYGLDRPAFLNSIEFRVGRGQDGRSVLLVRSREAISEPFVSFLVDVNWARGRLLREYTVLLDPPVLAAPSARQAAEPVTAPTTMPAPAPAPSRRESAPAPAAMPPAGAPAGAPVGAPVSAPEDSGGTTRRVVRGDTLYGIAGSMTDGDRQATQRLMLGLFRANPEAFGGNINHLRAGAILRVPDASEYADIAPADAAAEVRRQTAAWREARGAESGQLRLVTPEEGVADTGTGAAETSGRVESQIESLERDIAEQRRLLELRNQELAQLQRNLAERRAAEAAAAEQAAADQAAADQAAVPPPVDEAPVAPEDDVRPTEPAPAPPAERTPVEAPPVAAEKSFVDSLTENWMFLLGAAALLLIGILGFGYFRRRRDEDVSVALKGFELPESAPVPTETKRLRSLATGDRTAGLERPVSFEDQDFVVEERPIARPKPEAPRPVGAGHEETISAEAALDLDQADPLAEADFHMAYGLYDQAVDLVRRALQHSPDRNDLKLKLAEIHFVAGDTAQFLNVARDLHKSLGPGGDWDRMVIMGSQLAPTEPMFAGGVQDAGVDLSLEGGDNLVDLDLLSTPDGDEGLDLDLGTAAAQTDSDAATGENTAIEFNLDEGPASPTTTQEIVRKPTPGTVELPTLELPSSETPTVETPTLKRHKLASEQPAISTDSTAEMAIDDLGLDHGHLGELTDAEDATAFSTELGDDTTMIGRRDEATRKVRRAEDDDGTALLPVGDTSETAMLPKFETDGIDLDVGNATDDSDDAPTTRDSMVSEIPRLSELEPVTMSEVGTKLDLARAYMDMGDPDGARNILQEVLAEGSASQKQEARRLIDSLPGA
ncbi:MAG TPA: FimV/HubP family polar landmark protein [Steroidobacteraceae bacterium]|nr:FimV/HubP family polar landmark protein [Steroidobacteraceae bacterium]